MKVRLLSILLVVFVASQARAYEVHKFDAWSLDEEKIGWSVIRITNQEGDTYASEVVYTKKEVPTGPKNRLVKKTVSIRRAWTVLHRGLRLGQYRLWIPGKGSMVMYMIFRYGRRIKQRIETVLGASASVKVVTKNRKVRVVDPYGIMWAILMLRTGMKSFDCVNPVTGGTGKEHMVSYEKEVRLPQRGTKKLRVVEFTGSCGTVSLYFEKKRLLGGRVKGLIFELPCKECKKSEKKE